MVAKRIENESEVPTETLMTLPDVAEYLVKPEATLYQWRYRGEGPPGIKVGRHIRYRRSDVEEWLDSLRDSQK